MKYQIAIPSYNRATILKKKTLPLLKRFNINNSDIYIFVETEEMKKEYQASGITTYRYVVTNTNGICEKRNFLETYYREQVGIDGYISIDDDIQDIFELSEDSKTVEPVKNIRNFFDRAFAETNARGYSIWGVSPLHNPFFMSHEKSTNLKYICGALNGRIIRRDRFEIHADVDHCEDFQFSMEYFLRDGGVMKYNHLGLKTKYFEKEGGICGSMGGLDNRKKNMEENCKYMEERYPGMATAIEKKFGWDLKLNWRFKR
tara:strand:+ start:249 stop:1025 length:777 start_codon:yes stop_codon:yes gene_type:complete